MGLQAGREVATLAFTQTWASGDFKDTGTKQIVLVREGAALRIAREEMLSSAGLAADGEGALSDTEACALVMEAGGEQFVVIRNGASTAWEAARLRCSTVASRC